MAEMSMAVKAVSTRVVIGMLLGLSLISGAQAGAAPKIVYLLFDQTGSTESAEVRELYLRESGKVLSWVGGGDVLLGEVLKVQPLTQGTLPIEERFPAYKWYSDNTGDYKDRIDIQKKRSGTAIEKLLASPSEGVSSTTYSRLLDAISVASKAIERERAKTPGAQAVLVIFSDMFEESERINFRKDSLNQSSISRFLAQAKADGRIPSMSGVKIFAPVAGQGKYALTVTSDCLRQVENFWAGYFTAAGADFGSTCYGVPLPKEWAP